MELLVHSTFFSTTEQQTIKIEDTELYSEYSKELQLMHQLSLTPSEPVMESLMAKISLITNSTKSCVS